MGFKEVTFGQTVDIKKGDVKSVEGTYLGAKKIVTQLGEQFIYRFRKENGETVGVYGFTNLNMTMESMPKGAYCRVTYLGKEECDTKFGRKPVHQCKVEIDDEKSTSVEDEDIEI
jgi:hypothetical protein